MAYEYAVITNVGRQLLNEALTQKLVLDHASGGAGNVNPALLMGQTAVSDERQTFPIVGVAEADQAGGKGKKISIQVTNTDLSTSYNLRQLGIFAKLETDDEPKLLAILQDITGYHIPSSDEMKDFAITFYTVIAIGNEIKLEITMDPSALITRASMEDFLNEHNLSDSAHPHIISPKFEEAEKRENITSGEKLSTLFGKIKKWFSDLKAVAFSGKYSDLSDTPESLKNPHALKFTGAATASYDGSEDKTVEIPEASDTAPQAPGTAKAGSGKTWARSDHVHPLQTSVTGSSGSCNGNAETASKLKHIVVDGSTLDSTPGTFAFSGNNGPFPGEDWVGLQIGDSVDKFQLLVRGNRLYARQNDSGGANVAWSDWKQYAYTTEIPVWDSGDSFELPNNTPLNGIITSSAKNIHLMLPLGKPVKKGIKVLVYLTGTLRGAKGYINNSGEDPLEYTNDSISSQLTYALDYTSGMMRITITDSFTNVDNNTLVSFLLNRGHFIFTSGEYDEPIPGPEIFGDDAGMEGPSVADGGSQTYAPADAKSAGPSDAESSGKSDRENAQTEQAETERTEAEQAETDTVTDGDSEAVPEAEETEDTDMIKTAVSGEGSD